MSYDIETTFAELQHHGHQAAATMKFTLDPKKLKTLDLTDKKIAKQWNYRPEAGGENYIIGYRANLAGYNSIKVNSERHAGGVNLVLLKDFHLLKPQPSIVPAALAGVTGVAAATYTSDNKQKLKSK